MDRTSRYACRLTLCILALTLGLRPIPANAQQQLPEQAKPWFLVIMDTSGSMNDSTSDDSCGFGSNKMGLAKCALQQIIDSTGDAEFGLMQFYHPCRTGCDDRSNGDQATECIPQMLVGITDNGNAAVREWVDGVCQGTCDSGGYTRELYSRGYTPLGASLQMARDYFEGTVAGFSSPAAGDPFVEAGCRKVSVILLTDGDESCSGDPPARANDLHTTAMPVSGGGTFPVDVSTYVIGFGIGAGDADIENIGEGGCTCAGTYSANSCTADTDINTPCDPCGGDCTGNRGFYAQNEAELSAAFNQIIADAQLAPEICNNLDDNCNGLIDEGVIKYCDRPNGIDDRELCDMPPETECDGEDDNCDGQTDEGLFNACGFCGELPEEVCDGRDNDCDGNTDEGVEEGTACGDDTGECKPGVLKCVDGAYVCIDETGPRAEACNCLDDDCDGDTDEDPAGDLCPPGQVCFQCECVTLCRPGEEFGRCDEGQIPVEVESGRCFCVTDDCDPEQCAEQTLEEDGEVLCRPDSNRIAPCACKAGECSALCHEVVCDPGYACDPSDGSCAADTCAVLGCESGQRCDPLSGECVEDECADADCEQDQVCRDGECEKSCANLVCPEGLRCKSGKCVEDKCADADCENDETCDPEEGKCVENACLGKSCAQGQVCDRVSGECIADPCAAVDCPQDQYCLDGQCFWLVRPTADASVGPVEPAPRPQMVFGAGGSGCSCSLAGLPDRTDGGPLWLGAWLLWLAWLRRQRKTNESRQKKAERGAGRGRFGDPRQPGARSETVFRPLLALALLLLLLSGCELEPVCIANCDAAMGTAGSSGSGEGTGDAGGLDGGGNDAGPADGSSADGAGNGEGGVSTCEDPGEEICNLRDDDCDGETDEDLTPPEGFCGRAGVCESIIAVCGEAGAWICRFPDTYELNEKRCDGLDNDCDGEIDEGFAGLGTPCSVGDGACRREGVMVCKANRSGTECSQTAPGDPGEEICDNLDNDCDGEVDETAGSPGSHPNYVVQSMVKVNDAFWIHTHELSRPDATATSQGVVSTRPCSRAGVLPWTNLTYPQAKAACESLGLRMCTEDEWSQACRGATAPCNWSYTPASGTCNDYVANGSNGCNGSEYVHDPAQPGEWLLPAGYLGDCYADHGAAGRVYDLSGNVKEWALARAAGVNPLRGGSMNNTSGGLRCDFDFTVANDTFSFQNVGFRCCANGSFQP